MLWSLFWQPFSLPSLFFWLLPAAASKDSCISRDLQALLLEKGNSSSMHPFWWLCEATALLALSLALTVRVLLKCQAVLLDASLTYGMGLSHPLRQTLHFQESPCRCSFLQICNKHSGLNVQNFFTSEWTWRNCYWKQNKEGFWKLEKLFW